MPLNHNQQKQFNMVCARIAGGASLRTICLDEDLPDRCTVNRWLNSDNDGEICGQYARAREQQADHYVDEIIEIADDESIEPNSRRIKIDARKWIASRFKPKLYGDKLAIGGADDLPAIRQVINEDEAFRSGIAGIAARHRAGETRH